MEKSKTIVFIHGLFQNPKGWTNWKAYFEQKGYTCHTPAYPFHEGNPEELRNNIDPRLSSLTFGDVLSHLSNFIENLPEKPILIGHSMGGLAVQKLISEGRGTVGICINSAPPKGISTFKWSFISANLPVVNPFKGNSVFEPTLDWFQYAFCNTMSKAETQSVFDEFVVPESRNIPRTSTQKSGEIDFKKPHNPLLFIAGESDNIIPASLNKTNFEAYKSAESKRDFKIFESRTHYICGQSGWEEVANYATEWIEKL